MLHFSASFFLKGIAEVSSGVSIGGRPYFRNVPCFLSDRLFFASFPNLLLIFKFCLFHIIFLVEVKSFSVANIDLLLIPLMGIRGRFTNITLLFG
mgnify:CR=1 FL=1